MSDKRDSLSQFECHVCRLSRLSVWIALGITVASGVSVLAVSENVLSQSPYVSAFCDVMSRIFPVIDRYTAKSSFPEITKFYMSLMLAASPFGFLAALCSLYPDRRLLVPIQSSDTKGIPIGKHIFSAIAMGLLLPVLAYFHFLVNPGLDIWFMRFSQSVESLAFFGVFITLAIPFMLGGVLALWIRMFLGLKSIVY